MNYQEDQKYLAVDIGSNAMRASVAILDHAGDLEVIDTFRYPIRLGSEAFSEGKFSLSKIKETTRAFYQLKDSITDHDLQSSKIVATSAIRDSQNGQELVRYIKDKVGFDINIIDGLKEAELIQKAVDSVINLSNETSLLMDIGGGSTEFTIVENNQVIFSTSYPCGTLRFLGNQNLEELVDEIDQMTDKLKQEIESLKLKSKLGLCIGTGGNLRRMGKLRTLFFSRSNHKISQQELSAIKVEVSKLSLEQRVLYLSMRQDRADVILPAMAIVESVLLKFNLEEILLPNVGLKEGILIDQIGKRPRNIILN